MGMRRWDVKKRVRAGQPLLRACAGTAGAAAVPMDNLRRGGLTLFARERFVLRDPGFGEGCTDGDVPSLIVDDQGG